MTYKIFDKHKFDTLVLFINVYDSDNAWVCNIVHFFARNLKSSQANIDRLRGGKHL